MAAAADAARPDDGRNGDDDNDQDDEFGIPRWLELRSPSMMDAYGIVAKPILMTQPGPMLHGRLTGGWKGRPVTAMVESGSLNAVLWRICDSDTPMDAFHRDVGSPQGHAWLFPVGLPWFIGHVALPSELLLFLAERCKAELTDSIKSASEVIRGVLEQFSPRSGLSLHPATLMQVDKSGKEAHQRTIQLYESAIERRWSVGGFCITCVCNKPGGLQCLSCSRILEDLINECIGGDKYSRVHFISSTNGLTQQSTLAASGQAFHWLTRTKMEKIPENFLGKKCVIAYCQ
ncbi:protein LORF4 [Falconid herpesvirus 1]|uniref:Protein LORF4 n=2 Tax=Columbid alphaherpesvirus 1 TaxID=93386 RepID=A0A068ER56_9ALPH|nr:protein LORF4 [Falconid herpesvirus 1]YP_009352966.1 protein LORF4 [Columbid alphaherpesvirus 1]AID52762.1 protein LORF4 [Falconid herpesvirus 1]ARD71383.1 protein LORF4 [Columbid alphaherpesvirus 1]